MCISTIDIDSDSYVLFICNTGKLKQLSSLGKQITVNGAVIGKPELKIDENIDEKENPNLDAIIGQLLVIDENSNLTGNIKINKYINLCEKYDSTCKERCGK